MFWKIRLRVTMNIRFYIDPETDLPHIYNHGVDEEEVRDILRNPGDVQRSNRNSKMAFGQTSDGRYLCVVYVRDPEPHSFFVVTAYALRGNDLSAYRRRRRKKKGT